MEEQLNGAYAVGGDSMHWCLNVQVLKLGRLRNGKTSLITNGNHTFD